MMSKGMQIGIRHFLPLCAAVSILSAGVSTGQEKLADKLDSPIDEPHVVIQDSPQSVPVRTASIEITESTDPLVKLVYETREAQRRRLLSTTDHTPWQIMHGVIGLRQDMLINHNGKPMSALEWIKSGPTYMNESWFEKTAYGGRAHPFCKPYWFEGHINQFVGILAICNVPLDTQFGTPQGPVTMRDMLKNAQMTANEKEEVTWTIWALCTYLPSDAEWVNAKGERWSIERLVRLEVGKQVGGPTSPCGGTHGLFALARARNVYLRTGKPLRGVWLEADQKVQRYIETAKQLQNRDGTLSSNFFRGREYKQDFDKRMASCGHVLEFLMMAMPQERLKEKWIRDAIEATANDLMANRKAYVSCSPLYHATDALSIYLERVAPTPQPQVAQKPLDARSISSTKELQTADAADSKPNINEKTVAPPVMDRVASDTTAKPTIEGTPKSTSLEPKTEEPKTEEPKNEDPKTEEPKTEDPKTEEPKTEEPKTEDPETEDPETAEPKTEEPKTEDPKTEEPKTEDPETAEPKSEEPKSEEPTTAGAVQAMRTTPVLPTQSLVSQSVALSSLLPVAFPSCSEPTPLSNAAMNAQPSKPTVNAKALELVAGTFLINRESARGLVATRSRTIVVASSTELPEATRVSRASQDSAPPMPEEKGSETPFSGTLSEWKATLPERRRQIHF